MVPSHSAAFSFLGVSITLSDSNIDQKRPESDRLLCRLHVRQHGAELAGILAYGRIAALRRHKAPGRQATIGLRAGQIAEAILNEDTRHDGGWTLPRLSAEIIHHGVPAISPKWLSHQL